MKTFLKKTVLFLSGIASVSLANATVHTVTVMSYSFTPSSFSASVGDTVQWEWVDGGHTTTSTSVPTGAATWSHPMNSSSTSFEYVITVPGTYNYWCAIHTTMMEASFTVGSSTGVAAVSNPDKKFAEIYPNPTSKIINIHLLINPSKNEISITDVSGKEVIKQTLTNIDNTIDVSTWKKGIYFYYIMNDDEMMEGKFEVQ